MRITICGHAGLVVEAAGETVLLDPILRTTPIGSGTLAHCFERQWDLSRLPRPTLLAITHAHYDHLDPESLSTLDRDTPVVAPDDDVTLHHLTALGFRRITRLAPWQEHRQGGITVAATPTDSGIVEVGYVFEAGGARLWHMSDADADEAVGAQILATRGRVDVVAAKFQPAVRTMGQTFRCMGASFEKAPVITWLEAACATRPRFVFPYAAGVVFQGPHAWLNRHLLPYNSAEIADLLEQRLAPEGRSAAVFPGDVIEVSDGAVERLEQASPFLRHLPGRSEPEWEPIDTSTLLGVERNEDREELRARLEDLLMGPWARWVAAALNTPGHVMGNLPALGVVWQLAVHLGSGERIHYHVDFAAPRLSLATGRHARANTFVHIAGRSLLSILRGTAGWELLAACGDSRQYEKILHVRGGRFWAPEHQLWELYDRIPDPITCFLRTTRPYEGL
jgi:L-ascorbate metabolism protein UlaG (beta-lactamase superfamily)